MVGAEPRPRARGRNPSARASVASSAMPTTRRCSKSSSPKIETIVGDVRDPAAVDRLFDGIGDASVFHSAAVIHPQRSTRELFDVNVGGTQLVLDRARRVQATRFVHVSSNSPFGANADGRRIAFTEDSRVRAVPRLRAVEARGRGARAAQPGTRRPRHRHRPAAVVLRAVPARPADAVLRGDPHAGAFPLVGDGHPAAIDGVHRQPRRRAAARRSRWPPPPGTRTGSPTPSRTRCATSCRPCATRSPPKVSPRHRRASSASRTFAGGRRRARRPRAPGHRPLRAGRARARRVEGHDRVRHHARAQRARLRAGGRPARGDAGQHPVVPRTGRGALMARSVLVTGGSGYFGTVLAGARGRRGRRRPRCST